MRKMVMILGLVVLLPACASVGLKTASQVHVVSEAPSSIPGYFNTKYLVICEFGDDPVLVDHYGAKVLVNTNLLRREWLTTCAERSLDDDDKSAGDEDDDA